MWRVLLRFGVVLRETCAAWFVRLRQLAAAAPGQGLVEYGLVLMLIALVVIGVLGATGHTLSEVWYDKIIAAFPN